MFVFVYAAVAVTDKQTILIVYVLYAIVVVMYIVVSVNMHDTFYCLYDNIQQLMMFDICDICHCCGYMPIVTNIVLHLFVLNDVLMTCFLKHQW